MSVTRYDVRVFFNGRPEAMLDGYRDGDPLKPSDLEELSVVGSTVELAADSIWLLLNDDFRPNRHFERSLSLGDVLALSTSGKTTYLAAAPVGWKEVFAL